MFWNKKNVEVKRELFPGNYSDTEETDSVQNINSDTLELDSVHNTTGATLETGTAYTEKNPEQADTVPDISGKKRKNEKTQEELNSIFEDVLDYFCTNEGSLVSSLSGRRDDFVREEMCRKAKEQFKLRQVTGDTAEKLIKKFTTYLWGYDVLEPLINDKSIFDIKCYSDSHIRIKKMGRRMNAPEEIKFLSPEDYKRFVRVTATKNKVNISLVNALVNFTDSNSSEDFILRFDISTGFINSSELPVLHIRKIPKTKYSMQELVELGFMTLEQRKYFEEKVPDCGGILFTGSGGSGKTTFMNSLLELYPHNKSGLVIQENEELFSNTHPDMAFQHVVMPQGDGRVRYDLENLARAGLLSDIDLFVIGEIKGNEAGSFAMCSYTGAQAWCSCHGQNEMEAINKLADYVNRATGYSFDESLKLLSGIEIIVYMKDFHIEGVSEVKGWDYDKKRLVIEKKTFNDTDENTVISEDSFVSHDGFDFMF